MRRLARTKEQKEKNRKRRLKQIPLCRSMWKSFFNTANRGIKKVEAKFHKINLSGGYGYTALKSRLGDLADLTGIGYQLPKYDKKYGRKFENFDLTAFVNPKKTYLPDCYLVIKPTTDISLNTYKAFLEFLNNKLLNLKISSAEYTIDLFCNSLMENNILFSTIARTLYVRAQKTVSFPYGQEIDEPKMNYGGKKIRYNSLCHTGERTKFYQRGEDEKKKFIRKNKKGQEEWGWKIEDLDRVRLEFTADRRILLNCGIGDLHSFVENPKFWGMYIVYRDKNRLQFKEFKLKKHPCPWEKGSFQEKFLILKETLKNNIYRAMTESQLLEPLKSKLLLAMQEFDVDWSGNYIISDRKLIEIPY